jgi:hypothetical protein
VYLALWWVPEGHTPTIAEAQERLAHLEGHGPSPHAFTFKRRFAPDQSSERPLASMYCSASR